MSQQTGNHILFEALSIDMRAACECNLPLLKEDALSRLVWHLRRGRRPLHEARQRPDVRLCHLQRLVLGQFVVCKVCTEMHQRAARFEPANRQLAATVQYSH